MEGSKQPSVEDMIAVVEAGHRHLVEDLKNNHNHMMTTVENHHNHLVNGLRRLQTSSSIGPPKGRRKVHFGTQTDDTKATTMAMRSQASSRWSTGVTTTKASLAGARASQATTESGSQRPNSPHSSDLSQREHTDSSPNSIWDDEL